MPVTLMYKHQQLINPCVSWTIEAMRKGLTQFMGPTKIAVILGGPEFQNSLIFDGHQLLPNLPMDLLLSNIGKWDKTWPREIFDQQRLFWIRSPFKHEPCMVQDWFAETSVPTEHGGIVERWLGHASAVLHTALAADYERGIRGIAPSFVGLENFAPHVLGEYLAEMTRYESDLYQASIRYEKVAEALRICARLSRTVEEGTKPTGTVAFFDFPAKPSLQMFTSLESKFSLYETKRLGKLLQTVSSEGSLISDYQHVLGISRLQIPDDTAITVKFERGLASVFCKGSEICNILDGEFRCSKTEKVANIFKKILGSVPSKCLKVASAIVECSFRNRHGCTVVVDLNEPILKISGESLKPFVPADDDAIADKMGKVDGAVHINHAGEIVAFGCLLDGTSFGTEERSRGARFNSALRFSESNREKLFVIVASADGPINVFGGGVLLYSDPFSKVETPPLEVHSIGRPADSWLAEIEKKRNT